MSRPRILRLLRIAFSATCGIASLLLIVLWVRSYWRLDVLEQRMGFVLQAVQVSSVKGRIAIAQLAPWTAIGKRYLSAGAVDSADWRKGGVFGFAYYDDGLVTAFIAPHWLPALVSAGLAVIPWISWSWRFSLRTLLIATTLVAVVLGLVVYFSAKPRATPLFNHVNVPEF